MNARLALVLSASLALAACQGDGVAPPAASPDAADLQENLLTLVSSPDLSAAQEERVAAARERAGVAELHLARAAEAPGRLLGRGSKIRIALAPGVSVLAVGERVQYRGPGDISWAGPLRGANGWAQVVFMDGGVTASVTVDGTLYSVEAVGEGLHAVTRKNPSAFPPDHPGEHPGGALTEALGAAADGFAAARAPAGEVGALAATQVNVMVVYTASAASAAGNISSLIQLAVDETNQSYVNSGININMVRVHTAQVTYNEANRSFSQHVSSLRGTTDGQMDNVHTLRNTYAADVVVLVVNDSEACGMAAAIKATAAYAFAAAHYTCITGYYSFGHEVGHLQGARHDRFVDASTSPYAYGHGFIPSTKNWRTVMAYGNNCGNCTRIQWWSNPLRTYPATGQVMGTAAYEDNARVLNLTAATVAAFR